jgi:cation diffusion facilitator CzcD-associated flavoprotein CzcO
MGSIIQDEKSSNDTYNVIIVGAGISGINAAYRLQTSLPTTSYTILEARSSLGGTWDLFKYPGIRSDSDLHTFGFPWQPWPKNNDIADGPSIKQYMCDTAKKHGIDRHIQYRKRVVKMDWSSEEQRWRFDIEVQPQETSDSSEDDEKPHTPRTETLYSRFVVLGTGYYDYKNPRPASIPGIEHFSGPVIHPQHWDSNLDYKDKKIIIIGSGATAVTLLPSLVTGGASLVTMLQRSPSYVASRPMHDPMVNFVKNTFPAWVSGPFARWKNLLMGYALVWWCRAFPKAARGMLRKLTVKQLPKRIAHDPNFVPCYDPWEQRLCLCPDGDFFASLRSGKGDVVTGTIARVTPNSIVLEDGQELPADIIITATGLQIQLLGGAVVHVDGEQVVPGEKFIWRGTMIQDIPNAFVITGYTDASWTPGADATSVLIARMLKTMRRKGKVVATPKVPEGTELKREPLLNLKSTYIEEAEGRRLLPMSSGKAPWTAKSNYFRDMGFAVFGNLADGLEFQGERRGRAKDGVL